MMTDTYFQLSTLLLAGGLLVLGRYWATRPQPSSAVVPIYVEARTRRLR